MYQATVAISQEFDRANIKYQLTDDQDEGYSYVEASFKSKAGTVVLVKYISRDNDNDYAVRVFSLAHIPDEKIEDALKLINAKNRKFRYVKFVLDDDGDVNMEYDLPMKGGNLGPCAVEMFIRFVKIIDEVLPEFMHLIWA